MKKMKTPNPVQTHCPRPNRSSRPVKRKPAKASVLLDCNSSHKEFYLNIRQALSKLEAANDAILHIEIFGTSHVLPEYVLAIHDLLKQRPSTVKLHLTVRSSLQDGTLLLLLLADSLHVSETAWFEFRMPDELADDEEDEEEQWKKPKNKHSNGIPQSDEPEFVTDHKIITRILNECLPMEEFRGLRPNLAKTLAEFGLLPNPEGKDPLVEMFGYHAT